MKKIILIILSSFILSSCLIIKNPDELRPKNNVSEEPIIEVKNIDRKVINKKEITENISVIETNT